ncbi:3-dehydroquinate synthase [Lactiplantibacillus daowaiensis]|uniref:3-dehydroquinate synthase n=1 Tax=Lactiplantibacillus daowaiensis TaxID=2559918 RepID=A0ABW1RW15_9LACO|nr:3-dehydroquinate synthase [Lactiplantibacillus daowaiensis]
MTVIQVTTATKAYQVQLSDHGLTKIGQAVSAVWTPRQVALITDTNVGPHYAPAVTANLQAAGYRVTVLTIPAGEASKSWAQVERLTAMLSAAQFTRSDGILALGGGVVGDLAGFVAAIYLRGISLIQVPTSLLAQVDSSVGGKTAIDLPTGKNLIGSFYQPDLVLIDPATLTTLPARSLAEGYGEILKCAAIVGGDFWQLAGQITDLSALLAHAAALITASVQFKTQVVMADEKESDQRQLLNLGHTIGHAVELLGQGQWMHGEAVAIGLVQVCRLFEAHQLTAKGTAAQLAMRLHAVGLPTELPAALSPAKLIAAMQHDKKVHGDQLTWVYLQQIGTATFHQVPVANLMTWVAPILTK